MGLVGREIEAAGISTVCLSIIPDLTRSVGIPRVVGIEYPFGRTLGKPGDSDGQKAVVRETLRVLEIMEGAGSQRHLAFKWPETPAQARAGKHEPSPMSTYLQKHPWHLPRFVTRDIPPEFKFGPDP